jgi:hypothetical protein
MVMQPAIRPSASARRAGTASTSYDHKVAHTFEELIEKQRAADQAHARVEELRDQYGPPAHSVWPEHQTEVYETAWRAWRELARDVQEAVTEYAKEQGTARNQVEADVRKAVRHPEGGAAQ